MQSEFQFILNMFSWDEVRALCRPLAFLHTKFSKLSLYGACFVHRGITMLERVWAKSIKADLYLLLTTYMCMQDGHVYS